MDVEMSCLLAVGRAPSDSAEWLLVYSGKKGGGERDVLLSGYVRLGL
jgi:hypothetical protein